MASTTAPTTAPRTGGRSRSLIIGIIVIIIAIIAGVLLSGAPGRNQQVSIPTVPASRETLVATVSGSGTIAAAQSVDLAFQTSGTVVEVLVSEGDTVTAGQPLARIDTRDLELQVASAQSALTSAQTQLGQTRDGNVQQADIDAQQAAVESARAQLRSAQAQLAALKNPSPDSISTAEATVRKAELALQSERDNSSANKTKAEQDLQKAVDSLTQAQSRYATAKSDWEFVRETGQDPTNPETRDAQGNEVKNKLNETQRQQYYDTFVQAEAALRTAETSVQQAQVTFDNARQAEPTNIQTAEATLADAQAQLAALRNPTATDIAQRQASVDQAAASLAQAEANLAKLSAPGTPSDIAIQQASVEQAEQSLKQAELKLDQATLTAPFAGIISNVAIVPGSTASSASAAISLLNRDPLHIDLRLSENDVAQVELGQTVALTIDALEDWSTEGTVSYIAPASETNNNVVTYAVRVTFPDEDARVKVGMTADLDITIATKEDAIVVPNTALQPNGAGYVVQMLNSDGTTRNVEVETGLSDGVKTEIVSGLNEGDAVVENPGAARQQPGGPFGQ
jgi:HlyD family secretion protein